MAGAPFTAAFGLVAFFFAEESPCAPSGPGSRTPSAKKVRAPFLDYLLLVTRTWLVQLVVVNSYISSPAAAAIAAGDPVPSPFLPSHSPFAQKPPRRSTQPELPTSQVPLPTQTLLFFVNSVGGINLTPYMYLRAEKPRSPKPSLLSPDLPACLPVALR